MAINLEKVDLGSFGVSEQQENLAGQEGQTLQANMSEAIKVNPDQHAKTTNLSRESGVPEFAIQSDPVDVESNMSIPKYMSIARFVGSPTPGRYIAF